MKPVHGDSVQAAPASVCSAWPRGATVRKPIQDLFCFQAVPTVLTRYGLEEQLFGKRRRRRLFATAALSQDSSPRVIVLGVSAAGQTGPGIFVSIRLCLFCFSALSVCPCLFICLGVCLLHPTLPPPSIRPRVGRMGRGGVGGGGGGGVNDAQNCLFLLIIRS